jgi:hypothetical protein
MSTVSVLRTVAPQRPLPRLRGRDREEATANTEQAFSPPPPSTSERAFTPVFDGLCGGGCERSAPRHLLTSTETA